MQVKISQAAEMISAYIRARLVPMLVGSPGCGKSQIIYEIAKKYKMKVIDLRLSQCDPTDLGGFPTIVGEKADYMPMKHFPIQGDPIPAGYEGWLLFLDEATSAPPAIQAAAYKLILDRMVGSHHLHENVAIVCAGNLETDNAIVHSMSTALQSRMAHIELVLDQEDWLKWAETSGISHHITSFIKFKPSNLFTFKPDHSDKTYACPRTWEFANRLLKVVDINDRKIKPMLAGILSDGVALEFVNYMKVYGQIPTLESIVKAPKTIPVPEEISVLWALSGSLAFHMNKVNLEPIMQYVSRLPAEFQVICVRETIRRNRELMASPEMQKWIAESSASFID